ncbi:hypothetical protein KEM56_002252 [Ascosphaera pollenicola]|nr:hypothetical protein KEM56_002252 [Ascosphaera pollenicola]
MTSEHSQEYPSDTESGYGSMGDSVTVGPDIHFTPSHLRHINKQLQNLEPQGLATIDMLSKLDSHGPLDLIFLDTLYHFKETLSLVEKVKDRYKNVSIHVFRPQGADTTADFVEKYGDRLWERNEDLYDWVAKVEPAQRAYKELNVQAVLTGRRRSQGAKRGDLNIVEVDDAGLIKVNPLANWTFDQVQKYISENNVPYNELLDKGYKSVGDWHSTQPVKEGEDERAGRWKGQAKTECGIHNPRSKYAQFLKMQESNKAEENVFSTGVQVAS